MSEELREELARAIYTRRGRNPALYQSHPERLECLSDADAAIALLRPRLRDEALEEAAKVAEFDDERYSYRIASAIRALKAVSNG